MHSAAESLIVSSSAFLSLVMMIPARFQQHPVTKLVVETFEK